MTTYGASHPRKLDLGRVISDTFTALGRSPALFLGFAFLLGGVPGTISSMVAANRVQAGAAYVLSAAYWLQLLVMLLIGSFLSACLIPLGLGVLAGRSPSGRDILMTGAKFVLPMFGVTLILMIAVIAGSIFLMVPGIMMAVAWAVVGPIVVSERTSIMGVFGRSAELTRGNRWRILGLYTILLVSMIVVNALLGALGLAVGIKPAAFSFSTTALIGTTLTTALMTAIVNAGGGALYLQLRSLKEGVGPGGAAEVFD